MTWQQVKTYKCSHCGHILQRPEYADVVLNCPQCGEKKEGVKDMVQFVQVVDNVNINDGEYWDDDCVTNAIVQVDNLLRVEVVTDYEYPILKYEVKREIQNENGTIRTSIEEMFQRFANEAALWKKLDDIQRIGVNV